MSITYASLKNYVKHALAGDPASDIDYSNIINEAGRYLYNCHQWKFRERPPATVNFVASQAYVELPEDFGELVSYTMTSGLTRGLQLTTFRELAQLQASDVSASDYFWAAISHPEQTQDSKDMPKPRLEIWPTPTSSETGAITIWYRAEWLELEDDADKANVPKWAVSLLTILVRTFAQGYEEEGLIERLNAFEGSAILDRFRAKDGMIQPDYGPLGVGAVGSGATGRIPWDTISDPA